eukprot:2646471-Prymnesium_polylepis.1
MLSCLWTVCAPFGVGNRNRQTTGPGMLQLQQHTCGLELSKRQGTSARIAPKTRVAVCRVFWLARRALCYCHAKA